MTALPESYKSTPTCLTVVVAMRVIYISISGMSAGTRKIHNFHCFTLPSATLTHKIPTFKRTFIIRRVLCSLFWFFFLFFCCENCFACLRQVWSDLTSLAWNRQLYVFKFSACEKRFIFYIFCLLYFHNCLCLNATSRLFAFSQSNIFLCPFNSINLRAALS